MCLEDKDVGARKRAAASLGLLGETVGVHAAALVHAAVNDRHFLVKAASQVSINRVTETSIAILLSDSLDHDYVRGRAAEALGALGDLAGEQAINTLVTLLIQEIIMKIIGNQ